MILESDNQKTGYGMSLQAMPKGARNENGHEARLASSQIGIKPNSGRLGLDQRPPIRVTAPLMSRPEQLLAPL